MIEITDETFEAEVLRSQVPVLIDFYSEHCGPCRTLKPILETLAEEMRDRAKIVSVDVVANPRLTSEFNITVVPTLIVFMNGEEVQRMVGLKTLPYLRRALES